MRLFPLLLLLTACNLGTNTMPTSWCTVAVTEQQAAAGRCLQAYQDCYRVNREDSAECIRYGQECDDARAKMRTAVQACQ